MATTSESDNHPQLRLRLRVPAEAVVEFSPLLQAGFFVTARTGCSIKTLLCNQFGIAEEYVTGRITTIFLNNKPVDSLETTIVRDGATLALSGAMPGLVGATMRRGGFYAALREGISYHDDGQAGAAGIGTIKIKLFNILMAELGQLFLGRGITVSAPSVAQLLADSSREFRDSCSEVALDGAPIAMVNLVDGARFQDRETVRLTVLFDAPKEIPGEEVMRVTVKLFASFRTGRFSVEEREYAEGTTIGEVADSIDLPREEIGIMMVNSRHAKLDRELADGDILAIFPLLGGG
jgi:molybdopterin converting factor small subunit